MIETVQFHFRYVHCDAKKLHHFISTITLTNLFYIKIIIGIDTL